MFLLAGATLSASVIGPGVTSCPNGTISFTSVGFAPAWNKCGNATGVGSTATLDSTTMSLDAPVSTLENFLAVPGGTLNSAFLKIPPAPGSAIAQSFTTATGGTIDFDYTFTAEAGVGASSFFVLNGSASLLAFQQAALPAAPVVVPTPTHATFAAPAGTYTVGFGLVGQRQALDPTLLVANLAFTPRPPAPVPEPGTLLLAFPALVAGLVLRRRRAAR